MSPPPHHHWPPHSPSPCPRGPTDGKPTNCAPHCASWAPSTARTAPPALALGTCLCVDAVCLRHPPTHPPTSPFADLPDPSTHPFIHPSTQNAYPSIPKPTTTSTQTHLPTTTKPNSKTSVLAAVYGPGAARYSRKERIEGAVVEVTIHPHKGAGTSSEKEKESFVKGLLEVSRWVGGWVGR